MSRGRLTLGVLLLLALGLRLDGIGFGLDFHDPSGALFTNDVDERGMVLGVQSHFLHGNLHPGSFLFRGPLAFHLFGIADALVVAGHALFHPGGWDGVMAELEANPSLLHLVHRCVSALAGVLTVALLFRLVRREFDQASALASAAILAVTYLHVRDSHFGVVDVLFAFFTLAALDQMLLLIRDPRPRRYLACGLLAGVAAATKYFGVLLGAHLVLAHVFARREAKRAGAPVPGLDRLALALGLCPLGFFLSSPGALIAISDLVRHLFSDVDSLAPPMDGSTQWGCLLFHGRYTFLLGLGEPVLLLALAGVRPLWRRGSAGRFLILATVLLAPTLFATWAHVVRYGIAFMVLLVAPAGVLLASLLARLPRAWRPILVCCVLAPSLVRAVAFDRVLDRPDTRAEMLAVLRARGQPAEDVLAVGRVLDLPVPESTVPRPFVLYSPRDSDSAPMSIEMVLARPPRSILLSLATPSSEIPARARLDALLRARYREVLRLDIRADSTPLPMAEVGTPTLKISYTRPWQQTRPGPALVLYERVER